MTPFVERDVYTTGLRIWNDWTTMLIVDGSPLSVCGMDTLAFRDCKVIEYWTLSKEVDHVGRWGHRVKGVARLGRRRRTSPLTVRSSYDDSPRSVIPNE
jgi:hypothetical protein